MAAAPLDMHEEATAVLFGEFELRVLDALDDADDRAGLQFLRALFPSMDAAETYVRNASSYWRVRARARWAIRSYHARAAIVLFYVMCGAAAAKDSADVLLAIGDEFRMASSNEPLVVDRVAEHMLRAVDAVDVPSEWCVAVVCAALGRPVGQDAKRVVLGLAQRGSHAAKAYAESYSDASAPLSRIKHGLSPESVSLVRSGLQKDAAFAWATLVILVGADRAADVFAPEGMSAGAIPGLDGFRVPGPLSTNATAFLAAAGVRVPAAVLERGSYRARCVPPRPGVLPRAPMQSEFAAKLARDACGTACPRPPGLARWLDCTNWDAMAAPYDGYVAIVADTTEFTVWLPKPEDRRFPAVMYLRIIQDARGVSTRTRRVETTYHANVLVLLSPTECVRFEPHGVYLKNRHDHARHSTRAVLALRRVPGFERMLVSEMDPSAAMVQEVFRHGDNGFCASYALLFARFVQDFVPAGCSVDAFLKMSYSFLWDLRMYLASHPGRGVVYANAFTDESLEKMRVRSHAAKKEMVERALAV